jgi:hypothetical protein
MFDLFKGSDQVDGNGLSFEAYPKVTTSRVEMLGKIQKAAKEMGSSKPYKFSQIPAKVAAKVASA